MVPKTPFLGLAKSSTVGNCSTFAESLSVMAIACNGVSVTPINFNALNRVNEVTPINQVGARFRYPNVGTTPDGTVLDAVVTVTSYNNNQDSTPLTFRNADIAGGVGFDGNLQPSLEQENDLHSTSGVPWIGNITYRIQFFQTGTTNPRVINVAATSIDNDGSTACGGLSERVTYSAGYNQILLNNPTNQTIPASPGNRVDGPQTVQAGIGTGANYASSALYLNVSEISWTQGFQSTGNCTAGNASEDRFGSLNMSCQIDFTPDFTTFPLSGTVFNDLDGLTDSTVDGTGTGTPGGTQLYANLVDGNGNVIASVAVAANGTYNFPNVPPGTYTVRLSTTQGVESNAAPGNTLPTGWLNTGENLGAGAGNDGTVNGSLPVTVSNAAVTNANLGIEQPPTANNNTAAIRTNPGGTNNATVPATTFTATDPAGGTVTSIRITGFPTNATSITINGTTYTSATFPVGGVTVPTNVAGNPTQPILVDPIDGTTTVAIPYVAIDNAGVASAPATASVPFGGSSISGNVFNDLNGLTDSTVNGTGTNAGGPLYANLISGGVVVQSVLIPSGGAYTFPGVAPGSFTVQLSTNQGAVGSPAPATALPTGWVNTGENVGAAAGNDGTVNGLLPVTVAATPVTNANFGIEQPPTANNNTAPTQPNPGGTTTLAVPPGTFTATDPSGGTVSSIRITAFPNGVASIVINGVVYTSASFPPGGVVIPTNAAGNPLQPIRIDPLDGPRTVNIPYVAIDNAGVSSPPATATLPVTAGVTAGDATIMGRVLGNDGRGAFRSIVYISDAAGNVRSTMTNPFGYYRFAELEVGQVYVISVSNKRFQYEPRAVNLTDDFADLDFVPNP